MEPKANVKLAGSSAHIKIPANLGDTPVYYKFILEEKSPLNNRSRQNSASLVVAPAIIVPSRLVVLKSNDNDSATALAVDPAGNIYPAGRTTGSFSGKIPEVPPGSIQEALRLRSSFVARYDAKGNLAWGSELGKNTSVTCIGVDSSGNVYFGGAVEVREAPSGLFNESIIRSRAYLRKYDSNGNDLWARAIDADENDFVNGLAVDREGNVYVAGTAGPADSPSIPLGLLHTNTDAFLAKFDPAGSRIGPIHESGTDGDDGATAIGIDGNGMVYVTGFTDGADYLARYDTDLIKTAFLVQFDAEGRGRWVREYGALFESSPLLAVGADKSEAVYVAGGSGSKRFLAAYDAQGNAAWPQVQFSEFRYGSESPHLAAQFIKPRGR